MQRTALSLAIGIAVFQLHASARADEFDGMASGTPVWTMDDSLDNQGRLRYDGNCHGEIYRSFLNGSVVINVTSRDYIRPNAGCCPSPYVGVVHPPPGAVDVSHPAPLSGSNFFVTARMSDGTGRLFQTTRGRNYQNDNLCSGWIYGWTDHGAPPGRSLTSAPTAVVWGPNTYVFARDSQNQLAYTYYNDGTHSWTDWATIPGVADVGTAPTAFVSPINNKIHLFWGDGARQHIVGLAIQIGLFGNLGFPTTPQVRTLRDAPSSTLGSAPTAGGMMYHNNPVFVACRDGASPNDYVVARMPAPSSTLWSSSTVTWANLGNEYGRPVGRPMFGWGQQWAQSDNYFMLVGMRSPPTTTNSNGLFSWAEYHGSTALPNYWEGWFYDGYSGY